MSTLRRFTRGDYLGAAAILALGGLLSLAPWIILALFAGWLILEVLAR